MKNFLIVLLILMSLGCNDKKTQEQQQKPAITQLSMAFGSCNHQDLPQPLWKDIVKNSPELWIWLGDNIYGDTEDMTVMKSKYDKVLANADYQALIKKTTVMGIWDDHDYGVNDGGVEYPKKVESQQLMFDFLKYPKNAAVRTQKGAYHSKIITKNDRKIKIILLDARSFRDSLYRVDGSCVPNLSGTILGDAQWKWFEKELTNSDADVHIIGNGIQIIPEDHRFEKWANYPKERTRFFEVIAQSKAKNVLLISGDRHIAEVSKYEDPKIGYPIYEITSSGLTHTWQEKKSEKNRYRVGELIIALNFGLFEFKWGEKSEVIVKIKGKGDQTLLEQNILLRN